MSTRPGIPLAGLSKLLQQELAAGELLKQLLAAERNAITDRDIPAFEVILDRKRSVLERFAQYEQERILLLESQGATHEPGSMDDCIKRYPADNRLADLWQQLLSTAAECREQNRQNHMLVELCSAHTRKALCVLRGEAMEQSVYGPDGDTSDPHQNRSLAIV
jgi:flagella synthesis protein FlgN